MYTYNYVKKNLLLSIVFSLALLSSFWSIPRFSYINWQVIALLFNLMVVVAVFQQYKLLDFIAMHVLKYCRNEKSLSRVMILVSMAAAMFITNDVALISLVPITILIALKVKIDCARLIILQTIAANLASSLTPFGNPQNLYLYSYFHYGMLSFLGQMVLLPVVGGIFLWWVTRHTPIHSFSLQLEIPQLKHPKVIMVFIGLFVLVLLSVCQVLNYQVVILLIVGLSLCLVPRLLITIDYSLLLMFILLFVIVGNIKHIDYVTGILKPIMDYQLSSFWGAVILSQVASNVTTAIMLSPFTVHKMALLWGVNVGSFGTIIASMASLISYRLYLRHYSLYPSNYIFLFIKYNLLGLMVFLPLCSVLLWLF